MFNAYITSVSGDVGGAQYGGPRRYTSAKIYGWGKGLDAYPNYSTERQIGGTNSVIDYAVTNTLTGIGGSEVIAVGTGTYPHEIRLSNYDVHFASEYPINGSTIELQFVNPDNRDGISSYKSGTHYADLMIGLTDKKPTIGGNVLNGWDSTVLPWIDYQVVGDQGGSAIIGTGVTTILPDTEILFGEHTNTWAGMNEDGYEYAESWSPRSPRVRMGIDSRIPSISEPGGGRCSRAIFQVATPTAINGKVATQLYNTNPEDLSDTVDAVSYTHLTLPTSDLV